jgi:hypothetical protein
MSLSLDVTDMIQLNKNSHMIGRLAMFVRKSFEFHLNQTEDVGSKIRSLDYLTMDLPIPSYNGIVEKLNVRELLACATKNNKRYITKRDT